MDALCDPLDSVTEVEQSHCRDSCVGPWGFYSLWIAGKVLWNVSVIHSQNELISWHCKAKLRIAQWLQNEALKLLYKGRNLFWEKKVELATIIAF